MDKRKEGEYVESKNELSWEKKGRKCLGKNVLDQGEEERRMRKTRIKVGEWKKRILKEGIKIWSKKMRYGKV